jgi:CheY-like chemotaxis protein
VSVLKGRKVLVVEDEMLVSMLIEDVLTEHECSIVGPAVAVTQALSLVESEAIDIALLDVNLNGERTFAVADELRQRGVPFVFSTGYGAAGVPAKYGDIAVLRKPFQERELAEALVRVLG